MNGWLRRVRGALGVGVTWATGWGLAGGLYWLVRTGSEVGLDIALYSGSQYAGLGFIAGMTFSAVLLMTEGRRRFDELRIPRFAAWGALGGFVLGAVYAAGLVALGLGGTAAALAQVLGIATVLGASCAGTSLALARASEDVELLDASAATAEVGLSTEEKRTLLGDPSTAGS